MMKVFLGGTYNNSKWRDKLIPKLTIDYFNPIVDDWTPAHQEEELRQRGICDYLLYTISSEMSGVYSIAELIDDSNKRPKKTIFCLLESGFNKEQLKSLLMVKRMVEENGSKVFNSLSDVANFLNKTMISFKEFANISGSFSKGSFSKSFDWDQIKSKATLIKSRLGSSNKFKVYHIGCDYFLTDKNDNYKGYIEYQNVSDKAIQITASSSEIKRGFYNIMFSVILESGIKEILSDNYLSVNAINAYEKIKVNTMLKMKIKTDSGYIDFDKKILLSNKNYIISITDNQDLKKHFDEYFQRLDEERHIPSMFQRSFKDELDHLDYRLFNESFAI